MGGWVGKWTYPILQEGEENVERAGEDLRGDVLWERVGGWVDE